MKAIFIGDDKDLEKDQLYKVKKVKREGKAFSYMILLSDGKTKWVDCKQFRHPQPWMY